MAHIHMEWIIEIRSPSFMCILKKPNILALVCRKLLS